MRKVTYIRYDFRALPEERTDVLGYFLLDIPHMISFGVIPSREAINQVLATGGGSSGMGPGASWSPFDISEGEYWAVVALWEALDLRDVLEVDRFRYAPKTFIQDWDIVRELDHSVYLIRCREKYQSPAGERG